MGTAQPGYHGLGHSQALRVSYAHPEDRASRRAIWLSLAGAMAGSICGATAGIPVPVIGSMMGALAGVTNVNFASKPEGRPVPG